VDNLAMSGLMPGSHTIAIFRLRRLSIFQVQQYYRYLFKSSRFWPGATTEVFFFAMLYRGSLFLGAALLAHLLRDLFDINQK
jgi:hypothetical protein